MSVERPNSGAPGALGPTPARLVSRQSLVGSSILVGESVIRLGLVAAVSFWIAHRLGPAQFGLLNYASALVAVFWSAATLGMDTPLTARLALTERPGLTLGSAIALRLFTGALGAVAAIVAALLLRGEEREAVVLAAIVALSAPLSAPVVVDAWFKARNDALSPALARLLATVLTCTAKVACLLLGGGIVALAWTVALESLLVSVALLVTYKVRAEANHTTALSVSKAEVRTLLNHSWPFLLSTLAMATYMKLDVIMLGVLSTNEQTGLYSLSQKLCEVLYMVPVLVIDVLFPQLVRHHALKGGQPSADPQVFFDLAFASASVTTLLAIAVVATSLPLLFGEPYRPTVGIFLVHAWACLGIALSHARFKWMAATGRQTMVPLVAFVGLGLAIVGNVALIPSYGALGAATATVLAYAVSGYGCSFLFPSLRPAARMQTLALWPWMRLHHAWRRSRTSPTSGGHP